MRALTALPARSRFARRAGAAPNLQGLSDRLGLFDEYCLLVRALALAASSGDLLHACRGARQAPGCVPIWRLAWIAALARGVSCVRPLWPDEARLASAGAPSPVRLLVRRAVSASEGRGVEPFVGGAADQL